MPSSRPSASDAPEAPEYHSRLLPTLLIPAFVSLLAVSSVNVILPAVSHDLAAGTAGLQFVVSGYALVFGVVLVPAGRAGDVMGRGRIFVIGMLLFGAGALASGLAPDVVTLNLARVIMGVGSGLLNPQVAGIGVIGAWAAWERRYQARGGAPMVDLGLLTIPSFAYGSLAIAIYFLGYTSVWIIVAQYVQAGLGSTALASGLIGVPAALAGSVAAAVAGRRVIRVGRAMVLGGMAAGMAGLLASVGIIHMHAHAGWSPWWLTLTLLVLGVGQGLVVSPNQTLSLADVPLEYAGAAGGILQTGERIGASIGIAAITGLTFRVSHSSGWDAAAQAGLLAVVAAIAVAAGVAVIDLRLAARRRR